MFQFKSPLLKLQIDNTIYNLEGDLILLPNSLGRYILKILKNKGNRTVEVFNKSSSLFVPVNFVEKKLIQLPCSSEDFSRIEVIAEDESLEYLISRVDDTWEIGNSDIIIKTLNILENIYRKQKNWVDAVECLFRNNIFIDFDKIKIIDRFFSKSIYIEEKHRKFVKKTLEEWHKILFKYGSGDRLEFNYNEIKQSFEITNLNFNQVLSTDFFGTGFYYFFYSSQEIINTLLEDKILILSNIGILESFHPCIRLPFLKLILELKEELGSKGKIIMIDTIADYILEDPYVDYQSLRYLKDLGLQIL